MDETNTPSTPSPKNPASLRPRTRMVHAGTARSGFDETCEAIFMTSGFVYGTAEEAEAAFANDGSRFVYSRFRNPTVYCADMGVLIRHIRDRLAADLRP